MSFDVRVCKTVKEGIKSDRRRYGTTRFINYQPGNRTVYMLRMTTVSEEKIGRKLGLSKEGGWVFALLNLSGKTLVVGAATKIIYPSCASKLTSNKSDAYLLSELIAYLIGARFDCSRDKVLDTPE